MDNIFPEFRNTEECGIDFFANIIRDLPSGDILEFGVASGNSIIELAKRNQTRKVFGFDHFKGLEKTSKFAPEWAGWVEGAFRIGDTNYPDWIPSTLDELFQKLNPYENISINIEDIHQLKAPKEYGIGKIVAVNIDVDIYEPTVSCLNFIDNCIWDELYIRFDDWHGHNSDFDNHERLACKEWLSRNAHYEYSIPENGKTGRIIVKR